MFKFGKEKKEVELKSNFDMTLEALEESEKYLTKTVADMVSAAGGITLGDVVDPICKQAIDNTMEYYAKARQQILDCAEVSDKKEKLLNERLDKQDKILEEILKKIK